MSLVVLGIDPSIAGLGWSVGRPDMSQPIRGVKKFSSHRGDGLMFQSVRGWFERTVREYGVTRLVSEETLIPQKREDQPDWNWSSTVRSRKVLIGIATVLELSAADLGLEEPYEVPPHEWRKRFIGTTRAAPNIPQRDRRTWLKQRAIAECNKRGWYTENDNEAEAMGVMDWGLCLFDKGYKARTDGVMRRAQLVTR